MDAAANAFSANRAPVSGKVVGRLGRSDEIADMVVFLASSRAPFVSGTIVTVDAGRAARNAG